MKKISILWKLILAFVLVAITATAIVALFIRLTSVDRLTRLIVDQQRGNLQTSLVAYYQQHGSWNGVADQWPQLQFQPLNTFNSTQEAVGQGQRPAMGGGPGERDRRSLFGLADASGRVIVAAFPDFKVDDRLSAKDLQEGEAVVVDGSPVGTILTARFTLRLNPEEDLFLRRTNEALIWAAVGAILIAVVMGVFLARTLISPLRALTQAAQGIAQGKLEQQVKVGSQDEIGQLAQAFNRMSLEVARVNQQRKQMTADIAHDLRTPLTVIAGYIESMRDGVLKPTPERLTLIYTEIERLQNLVGDLKMLSQVDAGELPLHPQAISPRSLLEQAIAPFQHRAAQQQIKLTVDAADHLPDLWVDEGRMMQVFGNLISNALRYTEAGGEIGLRAAIAGSALMRLTVQDTGSGIAAEELPLIFDRFHRADKSRHSETGESGLGLAIVKALVEAHGGSIGARSVVGQGTTIEMVLPAAQS